MADLLTLEAAQALVLERARVLPAETVAIAAAAGRVLAAPAHANADLPPFPSSAMDGYAVRASDLPGRLPVAGEVAAGRGGGAGGSGGGWSGAVRPWGRLRDRR